MAEAYPQWNALEDSSIGLHGGHNRAPWISIVDAVGDDPYAPVYAEAPIGAAHPLPRFSGLVVVGYDTAELLGGEGPKTWRVHVLYGPASDRTIGLWRRSVRFASETKMLSYSLPEYYANGSIKTKSFRIGSYAYEPVDPTVLPDPGYRAGTQRLKRTEVYVGKDIPVNTGITALIYEILAPQLSAKKVRELGSLKWYTNAFEWLGYPAWTLQFSNYAVDDEVLALPGNRGTTAVWYSNVMIEILYKPKDKSIDPFGFRAAQTQDEWVRENGSSAPVTKVVGGDEVPVTRNFVRYPEVSFSTLFGIVGYGSPAN